MNSAFPFYHLGVALRKIHHKYPTMNYGGCGAFAYYFSRELEYAGYSPDIATCGCYTSFTEIQIHRKRKAILQKCLEDGQRFPTVRDWNYLDVRFTHVYTRLLIDDKYWFIDSEGIYADQPRDYSLAQVSILRVEDMHPLAEAQDGWNNTFDRRQIPGIRLSIQRLVGNALAQAA